jgi:hypothetical protein
MNPDAPVTAAIGRWSFFDSSDGGGGGGLDLGGSILCRLLGIPFLVRNELREDRICNCCKNKRKNN